VILLVYMQNWGVSSTIPLCTHTYTIRSCRETESSPVRTKVSHKST